DPEEIPAGLLTGWRFSNSATGQLSVAAGGNADRTVTATYTPAVGDLILVFYQNNSASSTSSFVPTCTDDGGGTYTLLQLNAPSNVVIIQTYACFVRNQYATSTTPLNISVTQHVVNPSSTANLAVAAVGYAGAPTYLQSQPALAAIRQSKKV